VVAPWARLDPTSGEEWFYYGGHQVLNGAENLWIGSVRTAKVAGDIALHHAWPKYLGGAIDQELVPLARKVHEAFHGGLDKILPRQWGTKYYDNLPDVAKTQVYRDLADYTRAFDAKYGTKLYDAAIKAGLPVP